MSCPEHNSSHGPYQTLSPGTDSTDSQPLLYQLLAQSCWTCDPRTLSNMAGTHLWRCGQPCSCEIKYHQVDPGFAGYERSSQCGFPNLKSGTARGSAPAVTPHPTPGLNSSIELGSNNYDMVTETFGIRRWWRGTRCPSYTTLFLKGSFLQYQLYEHRTSEQFLRRFLYCS